ncbi:MAG: growth inhibitor PemK [Proteobacteria bacterium]|nr:growth inhibitor PemK [Pseudomonadota bacterium]
MAIPTPEVGLVLNYAYLWHDEHRRGLEEGRKNRPSVIVLKTMRAKDGETIVMVLPITHSAPINPELAVETPARVKAHLGLDDERSWVVVDEGNQFVWPGYDLRKIPGSVDDYAYGFIPPKLFWKIIEAMKAVHAKGGVKSTPRNP